MIENNRANLVLDFEFNLRKNKGETAKRPDLILENKGEKKVWVCDMTCQQQQNFEKKYMEKLNKCH